MKADYIERLYAGWLGKLIGVRHGAPIEGWHYAKINTVYGEISDYLVDYKEFAADDDTNGPMFLLRTLLDHGVQNTAKDVGLALLNYAPYEHGFFWWGGYGVSTEHTAYLNLRAGMAAPVSGSIEQNGLIQAEQIGGQIFIDTWGLVAPYNPGLAAEYARKAASVTHGGNGVYGGMFISACISAAFEYKDVELVIEAGLSCIPSDCTYAVMARDVIAWYRAHPKNWRDCFALIQKNYGYDKYTGACHIIPNAAVIILSLVYGEGSFSKAINICNMCGWDTDCNVGNVGTIMGVMVGLEGIEEKWRGPINDFYVSSSVMGSLNINDVPADVCVIARLAYEIARELPPVKWRHIFAGDGKQFHFELPGSTHGFRIKSDENEFSHMEAKLMNSDEEAMEGIRSLKAVVKPVIANQRVYLYHQTYYRPSAFHDSRYDPSFSPTAYPGQHMQASVMITPSVTYPVMAALYAYDDNHQKIHMGEEILLNPGKWQTLCYDIPAIQGGLISEIGVTLLPEKAKWDTLFVYMDQFSIRGQADYSIDFAMEQMEVWHSGHKEVSQFTYLRGRWAIEDGVLSGNGVDYTEAYTGSHDWKDYIFTGTVLPVMGETHMLNIRVQGGIRSYAAGFKGDNKLCLCKNENGYRVLAQVDFPWEHNHEYRLWIKAAGNIISCGMGEKTLLAYTDEENPYLYGAIGASVPRGHCYFKDFAVQPLPE